MGVAAENHVEPVHPPGQLEVDGQTVVREQHDQVDVLVVSQLVDERLDSVLADAEGEVGHEAPGMGHRRVRERLADDSHTDAADLSDRVRVEDAIAPACDRDVVRDEVAGEESPPLAVAEELAHPLEAVDELPVRREDVDPELVGDAHHVLTAAPEGGRRTLEGVAAVEDQRTAGPLRADPLHQRRQVRVAAHPPVARRQRGKVEVGAGVRLDRAGRRGLLLADEHGSAARKQAPVTPAAPVTRRKAWMPRGCGSSGVSCRFGVAWLGVSEASVPYGPEVRIPD